MSQMLDPSYNAEINSKLEKITLVRHLPSLPPASSMYVNDMVYVEADTCCYHCISEANKWVWERVTHGMKRRYVLDVAELPDDGTATFNACIVTLNGIVDELAKRYDVVIAPAVADNDDGITMKNAIALYDRLRTHVNKVCVYRAGDQLPEAGLNADSQTAAEFICNYVNPLVNAVNPNSRYSRLSEAIASMIPEPGEVIQEIDIENGYSEDDVATALNKLIQWANQFR